MFDFIGPMMVSPSSSHITGTARTDVTERAWFGKQSDEVDISFYGSFAKAYNGHETDVAFIIW